MINHLKRKLLLVTVMSLLSLFLAACGQSGADSGASSETQSTKAPNASPNSNTEMSKMEMPAKPSPAVNKELPTHSSPNQVVVENFSFQPGTLTVAPGTTVTWVNHDDEPHTVNENNKTFKSGTRYGCEVFIQVHLSRHVQLFLFPPPPNDRPNNC